MAQKRSQATMQSNGGIFPVIENLQQFRSCLVQSLAKFGDNHTIKTANEEIKELMTENITNTDRMNAFLFALSESNEHMKPNHKKELIKLYSVAAEIFEDSLIPFLPKILTYLQRKLKEQDPQLHVVISDSLGQLVHHVLKKIENLDELLKELNPILNMIFTNLLQPNKNLQVGSAMSLTRVIQNAPVISLQSTQNYLSSKILEILSSQTCKCQTQILESLISLILAVEEGFAEQAIQFLPNLLECMAMDDWTIRKMAIDVIYTMAAILKGVLSPYKKDILEVLNHCKTDKMKPVREATTEAIQAMREITGEYYNQSLARDEGQDYISTEIEANVVNTYKTVPGTQPYQRNQKQIQRGRNSVKGLPEKNAMISKSSRSFIGQADDQEPGKKNLTSATQKKLQRGFQQQLIQHDQQQITNSMKPKKSIFKGPKNNNFFSSVNDDIEILEAPQKYQSDDNQNVQEDYVEYVEQEQENIENQVEIQIYEGKKIPLYQNPKQLEQYLISSGKKSEQTSSNKKVSPLKKSFIEQTELRQQSPYEEQKHSYPNNVEENKIDQRDFLSQQQQQLYHQQMNNPNISTVYPNQMRISPQQCKNLMNQDFTSFSPPQFPNQIFTQNASMAQIPLTQVSPGEQQMQFLLNELEKIHKNQIQMMERVNEYQTSQKQEMFNLQSRLAKLEDSLFSQQQIHKQYYSQSIPLKPIEINEPVQINRQKWNQPIKLVAQEQNIWQQIVELLGQGKTNEAYKLILNSNMQSNENSDLLLIKLIGRTGVCLNQLDPFTIECLLNRIISILSLREFIDVLLPWVAAITKHFQNKGGSQINNAQLNLNSLSNLVECLILLLNDQSQGGLNEVQRAEVQQIYLSLQQNLKK